MIEMPDGSQVTDGETFVITDNTGGTVTFEFESGYSLFVPETLKLFVPTEGKGAGRPAGRPDLYGVGRRVRQPHVRVRRQYAAELRAAKQPDQHRQRQHAGRIGAGHRQGPDRRRTSGSLRGTWATA